LLTVVNALREWRLACPKGELDLVFPNGRGKVESHANIANRGFYALQIKAAIVDADSKPKYGMHALRHFYAPGSSSAASRRSDARKCSVTARSR
jgi:integrase